MILNLWEAEPLILQAILRPHPQGADELKVKATKTCHELVQVHISESHPGLPDSLGP